MRLLAPHHDDALLSLPAALLCRPKSFEIVVCFSEESAEMAATCSALHRELCVDVRLLGLQEALRRGVSLRRCLRPSRRLEEVFSEPLLDELSARLRALDTRDTRDTRDGHDVLLAPLLPVHLDHALTRAAAERAAPTRLGYYEDQPYAALHSELRDRLRADLEPEWAGAGSSAPAIAAILNTLRNLVSPRQIARIEAAYAGNHFAERIWFRKPQVDADRSVL